jgi:hypothetical protein
MEGYLSFNKREMINYIKVRDYVFEQNSEVTLSEELDLLKQERNLIDDRIKDIQNELESLKLLENGN